MCGVYGNLTGARFSKRAEDSASPVNLGSFVTYGGGIEGEREDGEGGYMTVMTILKHNILCGARKRDISRQ